MENLPWQLWLVGTLITAAVGVLGTRYFAERASASRQEAREIDALQKENHGKEIDADVLTLKLLIDRITSLEKQAAEDRKEFNARLDRLNERVAEEREKSAKLTAENEAIKEENSRQARRLHDLADTVQERGSTITLLRIDLENLRKESHDIQKGNQRVSEMPDTQLIPDIVNVRLVDENGDPVHE